MKFKLKGRWFDTTEEILAESQRVLDTLWEKDFQEVFQKWRRWWDRCLHAGESTSRVMAAERPYGGFYNFYSVSPKYFFNNPRDSRLSGTFQLTTGYEGL
jgi:hypothetical protein